MLQRFSIVLCAVSLLLLAAGPAGATSYTFVDLGTLAGGTGVPTGVNASGQVTGFLSSNHHGFLYSGGTFTDIGAKLGTNAATMGFGINDSGQIAATPWLTADYTDGYLYSGGTNGTTQRVLFSGTTVTGGQAAAIDSLGEVVGNGKSSSYNGGNSVAYVANSSAVAQPLAFPTNIPNSPAAFYGYAFGVNQSGGTAAGWLQCTVYPGGAPTMDIDAILWSYTWNSGMLNSTPIDLRYQASLPGQSVALSVNNSGYAVGWYNFSAISSPNAGSTFLYHANDSYYTDLGAMRFYSFYPGLGVQRRRQRHQRQWTGRWL